MTTKGKKSFFNSMEKEPSAKLTETQLADPETIPDSPEPVKLPVIDQVIYNGDPVEFFDAHITFAAKEGSRAVLINRGKKGVLRGHLERVEKDGPNMILIVKGQ